MSARVNAELGRPETPEETADRKAAASAAYRSSQTARNLIVALLVTLAVVLVVVLGVPRGEPAPRGDIDVAAVAAEVADSEGRAVVVPDVPQTWRVNGASVEGTEPPVWTVVLSPPESAYVRVAQAFDADDTWAAQLLRGTQPRETVTIGGVEWDVYEPGDPSRAGNVSYALGTQAGADHVLIYGTTSAEATATIADDIAAQLDDIAASTGEGS